MQYLPYIYIFLFGICVGSFLNVCIYRIPNGESVVVNSSHCPSCNKKLKWWELFPVFSFLALRGKCSKCKSRISIQYPLIEALNGLLWIIVFVKFGFSFDTVLGCLFASALLTLAMIDAKTKEIPFKINVFIALIAVIHLILHFENWLDYLLGCVVVTTFLLLLFYLSKGGAIGGGDVKLMVGCGLYLGLSMSIFAFLFACIIGSFIHIIRMKFFGASRELAMGPYLAIGVFTALICGEVILNFYFSLLS